MTSWQQRIRQLTAALAAVLTAKDHQFVQEYLQVKERALFYQMNLPDQYHALQVAYSARRLAVSHTKSRSIQLNLLIRAALLHDVGRLKGDVTTFDKIWTVLFDCFWEKRGRKWASQTALPRDHWRRALYLHYCHGEVGADRLQRLGCDELLVALVRVHHQPPRETDSLELSLLRQADELH
ncbi:MAG: HD domain-containing protein [Sporomusaceae bacterium]|nr:HD domain-containing protein [Sporomusaceae bacterium]